MKARFVIFAALVAIAVTAVDAQAAQPQDVAQVVALMSSESIQGAIARKTYEDGGVQIVFVRNDRRYTLYYYPTYRNIAFNSSNNVTVKKVGCLSVWVRPNGTSAPEQIETFSDDELNGQVDFGITGKSIPDSVQKLYWSGNMTVRKTGEEFRAYWQGLYDRAITATLRQLKKK